MIQEEVHEPAEPLIARRIERGQGDPIDRRVTVDGDVLERSSMRSSFDGEEWHFDAQPLVWRRVVRLSAEELAAVRAAIEDSGFMDAPPERRPSGTSIGGSNVTWTASLNGRSHTVILFGVPDVHDPAVDALEQAVQSATASALHRAASD